MTDKNHLHRHDAQSCDSDDSLAKLPAEPFMHSATDSVHIDFDPAMTPFVDAKEDTNDTLLQQHQQQVADEIQLQFLGAISTSPNDNKPLLIDVETEKNKGLQAKVSQLVSEHSWLLVLMIHVLVVTIALIFGRVDISGLNDIPLEQTAPKPLPVLNSYLITEEQYNKLVEKAQQAELSTPRLAIDDQQVLTKPTEQ
ncbi:hypothetical protein [Shewanella phaeophyticola]|uniref:Uncharacterized protein n=1 Tax=Shewanella phaeophyticola TaxID=2978345 RepID=A0ABT2P552_9GAMM|nr:hypothetical protein [Shewanella sp. KJ10-1]MCT8986381.1 hypothetical protein [Shewanella sp. KJ10-1]